MTNSERVLLELISSSLFGIQRTYPVNTDWDYVLKEAQAQAVVGVVGYTVPERNSGNWTVPKYQILTNYFHILYIQQQLIELLTSRGIPLAILKGTAAAIYYPIPSQRAMGDIDFIVPRDRYEEAKTTLLKEGYVITHPEENPPARHIGFQKDGVHFELHHHFSYEDLDIEAYIIDGLKHPETATIDGFSFPMLPKLANGLVLLAHLRRHLQSGVGLRQVIDWMMYVDKVLDDEFWDSEFREVAERLNLTTLAKTATRMCQMYLGLPTSITWCSDADTALCESLMENLLASGNFGRKKGAGGIVESVTTTIRREGMFHYLQRAGEYNWKAYHSHKNLRPFCWLYQIGRYIRKGVRTRRGTKLLNDMNRGEERYELLKKLDIV